MWKPKPKTWNFSIHSCIVLKRLDLYNWLYRFGKKEVARLAHAVPFIFLLPADEAAESYTLMMGQEDNIMQVNCYKEANKCIHGEKCELFLQ